MVFKVFRSVEADADIEAIIDHLVRSHLHFGRNISEAVELAAKRIQRVQSAM